MKKLWLFAGKAAFWVTWPGLFILLRFSKRTRVFIRCGDELLVVRGWLGGGEWSFPGGGLHRNEEAAQGAVREVFEETGIQLEPNQLTPLFEKRIFLPHGLNYHCLAYGVDVQQKPITKEPAGEITAIAWQPIDQLRSQPQAEKLLNPALAIWEQTTKG